MSYESNDVKTDTAKIIKTVLEGICIIICVILVLGALFGTPLYITTKNNDKVQHLTEICIEKGYDGWLDFRGDDTANLPARSYCYNEGDEDK